jgi:hypothetical protein
MAFVGPILPADPARLAAALAGCVDRVLVDRMNYVDTFRGFYVRAGLVAASTESFFQEMKSRYADELGKRDIPFELLF